GQDHQCGGLYPQAPGAPALSRESAARADSRAGADGWPSPGKVDTGLCGFCLCLLWGDVADGRVDPRTIVIAFDISEQVAPRAIAIGVLAVVDQLGFQCAEEALHWRIVPAVSLAADGLALGAQFGVDARRSVSFLVLRMNPPDVDQQRAIGDLAWAVRP